VDLASPEQVEKVKAWLDDHFNRLRIVETNYCEVPYEILLSVGRFDPARTALDSHIVEHDHSEVFSTWSYETEQPLALEALREAMRVAGDYLPGQRSDLHHRLTTATGSAAGGWQATPRSDSADNLIHDFSETVAVLLCVVYWCGRSLNHRFQVVCMLVETAKFELHLLFSSAKMNHVIVSIKSPYMPTV
jgi:hypothetical protein